MEWKQVEGVEGLWALERPRGNQCFLRSLAFKLEDGTTAVISPIAGTPPEALDQLEAIGTPSALIAPNHFHNLGLRGYLKRFSQARPFSTAAAAPRLKKQTGLDCLGLDELRERLPAGHALLELPGARNGEVWLRMETGAQRAWVVGDAFANFRGDADLGIKAFLTVFDAGPGVRLGRNFRWLALRDPKAFRAWCDEQLETPPDRLVTLHGDIASHPGLGAELREALTRRFGAAR